MNAAIVTSSLMMKDDTETENAIKKSMAPEYTEIENLEYFHLKDSLPLMSLVATHMRSQGEEIAEFRQPYGIYNFQKKNESVKYQGDQGTYRKLKNTLSLTGNVKVTSEEAQYFADKIKYFFSKDLFMGNGHVKFEGDDLKTKDHIVVTSEKMRANPQKQYSRFEGSVEGELLRKRQYEGKMIFKSVVLEFFGLDSLAQLQGNVFIKRENYVLTAGKADIYLENYNKSLKYFVLNDDVKMREKFTTPEGVVTERRAFAERMEGFGREQKVVLSGAPRVEQGDDVTKGYRITVRENTEVIEVDDAMSDVQVKQKKLKD
jgi:lipopolysaccharide export system protein LptA